MTMIDRDLLKENIRDRLEEIKQEVLDEKRLLGKKYDHNCFGSGFSSGQIDALQEVLDLLI